jgi:hypothetical protein
LKFNHWKACKPIIGMSRDSGNSNIWKFEDPIKLSKGNVENLTRIKLVFLSKFSKFAVFPIVGFPAIGMTRHWGDSITGMSESQLLPAQIPPATRSSIPLTSPTPSPNTSKPQSYRINKWHDTWGLSIIVVSQAQLRECCPETIIESLKIQLLESLEIHHWNVWKPNYWNEWKFWKFNLWNPWKSIIGMSETYWLEWMEHFGHSIIGMTEDSGNPFLGMTGEEIHLPENQTIGMIGYS